MVKSKIFYGSAAYKHIEKGLIKLINGQADFLSGKTATSPRAAGDAIQGILSDNFRSLIGDFLPNTRQILHAEPWLILLSKTRTVSITLWM